MVVPAGQYYVGGGNVFSGLRNVTFQLDGTLAAVPDCYDGCWPTQADKPTAFEHIFRFSDCVGLTIASRGPGATGQGTGNYTGMLDGNGKGWWNKYVFGNHSHSPKRPKMLVIENSTDVLVSRVTLLNSPSFNLMLDGVVRAEVAHVRVRTDRHAASKLPRFRAAAEKARAVLGNSGAVGNFFKVMLDLLKGDGLQPEDLNTDGIDPKGRDIWIHDIEILNDDDSIAVKPCDRDTYVRGEPTFCSENILIENAVMTGFGASIGSVPPHEDHNCVRNVTFRNITMPDTGKGVYVKSNPECASDGSKTSEITDILYEDIEISKPSWWPVWIGPQQQHEPGSALGDKCALDYPVGPCPTQDCVDFRNITLRRIKITDPLFSPGVILGNASNPMTGIVFDNVTVERPGVFPFDKKYKCEYANGMVLGDTSPVPGCF